MPDKPNTLYFGDNLRVLREHIPDESIDLIYLDPPFNSSRNYNVLFRNEKGQDSEAQITAFEDTWHWNYAAEETYAELTVNAPIAVSTMIGAMREFVGSTSPMMAYLVMMAARLLELHRVLRGSGTLYLHCDPVGSHYLKMLLDTIFASENFRNEVIWQRTLAKGLTTRRLPDNHDVILCYQKSEAAKWNIEAAFATYDLNSLDRKTAEKYTQRDSDGRLYQLTSLLNPNADRPNLTYEFLGITRVWRWTKDRMQAAYEAGLVVQSAPGKVPRFKRYLDEQRGKPLGDVWTDIPPLNSQAAERLGYPTQKPITLLERIIRMSSSPGDVVLDPFCGCGTAVVAAQGLGRRWIGIDITYLAIALIRNRITDMYPDAAKSYRVIGLPEDVDSARQLAIQTEHDGRYQFQFWALSLIGAKPLGADSSGRGGKKGADRGIDGVITFLETNAKQTRLLVQVKSGHVNSATIRDLRGTVEREKAAIGVLITLEAATREMERESAAAGFYHSDLYNRDYPKIQILTVEQLLHGSEVKMPPLVSTFKRAQRAASQDDGGQLGLFDDTDSEEE